MPGALGLAAVKDGNGTLLVGSMRMFDVSGTGAGPWVPVSTLYDPVSGALGTIKPASTAPVATDSALVVAISPNSQNANGQATKANSSPVTIASDQKFSGQNQALPTDQFMVGAQFNTTPTTLTTGNVSPLQMDNAGNLLTNLKTAIPAGSNLVGKVGIDQTTVGTTNGVTSVPATSGGLSRTRTLIPNNTTNVIVKASAGQVYKIRATNNSSTIAYVKLYDAAAATAGSGTPVDTIMIPAASAGGAGIADWYGDIGVAHATGITFIVTTGIADADTTAPAASAYVVTVFYK